MADEHTLVQLARNAVESYVRAGKTIEPPPELTEEMQRRAGVFVSLHRRSALRGCIGTIEAVAPNVAREIINNAISAATCDPRFAPVTEDELPLLCYSVDVLSPSEPIESEAQLDPARYGVIVEAGRRRGLLLPDLPGVDSAQEQVAIARQKAGIGKNEPVRLRRFTVERHV